MHCPLGEKSWWQRAVVQEKAPALHKDHYIIRGVSGQTVQPAPLASLKLSMAV